MKKFSKFYFVFVISFITISSCGKKVEAPKIEKWATHDDPYMEFKIDYPDGWLVSADPKKLDIYSGQEVANSFYELKNGLPISGDPKGIEIEFGSTKFIDAKVGTVEAFRDLEKANWEGIEFANEKTISMGKENGVEFTISAKLPDAKLSVREIIVARDSVFYFLKLSGLNDYFEVYSSVFEQIIGSVKLPRAKLKSGDDDVVKPSKDLAKYSDDYFEFSYPDNFEKSSPALKGKTIYAINFMGYRQDCTFQLDVMPAEKLDVEKVFNQNKGRFPNIKSEGSVTIDGNAAKFLNYSPVAKVDQRVYFTVKNDKVYRIILTWFTPMANDFKPAFEKVVSTIKIK